MAIVLDEATRAEYLAQTLASSRASGVVSALTGTVYVEVYDGTNVLRASGTMASPWATSSGATITVGEVTAVGMIVSSGGAPDSLWYAQFRGSNGRFVRGTFGVSTDTAADFRWNQTTFQTGSKGTLGTVTLTALGETGLAPVNSSVPVVVGAAQVGSILTTTNGTWANSPTNPYTYQWQRSTTGTSSWASISSATSASYTPQSGDLSYYVRSAVTASNDYGAATAYSVATSQIGAAPVAGSTLTTVLLSTTAATGQTYPFTVGVAFAKGATTSVTTDLSTAQVVVKRRWNDGSVKHAIVSGRAAFTSTTRTVTISSGTQSSGTALTSASIAASGVTASVQCGAFGTVSLASLLSSPVRTWISGSEMVECHYRGDVGGGTLLSVWFHVRLYADGRKWVRAIVENGLLDNGSRTALASNAMRSYVPTITIGGTTVYNNGGVAVSHWANSRYMAEGWIGGDPLVVATQNRADLMSSKLVPYIAYTSPTATALNAQVQTYTPLGYGNVSKNMGATAYQDQIGVFPRWDALYLNSGDSRARNSVFANASHFNTHAVVWRDATTREPFRISQFPTWTVYGPNQGGAPDIPNGDMDGSDTIRWNLGHFGSSGYLAYLMSGEYWHYETMAFGALMPFLSNGSLNGSGVNRILAGEPRGRAWPLRSMAQYAALATDDDLCAADVKTWLANNYTSLASQCSPEPNQIGLPFAYSNYGGDNAQIEQAPWQFWFMAQANGHASDIEPYATSTTALLTVRNFMYKFAVGMLGDATGYYYTYATPYQFKVGPGTAALFSTTPGTSLYQTWAQVWTGNGYTASQATGNTLLGTSAGAPTGAKDYWGQLHATIAWAVEHNAAGALDAYTRLTSASNWLSGIVNSTQQPMADYPQNATTPRNLLPSWVPAAGTFANISLNTVDSVKPTGWPSGETGGPFALWSGGCFASDFGTRGGYVVHGSGHVQGGNNFCGVWVFDLESRQWVGRNVPSQPMFEANVGQEASYWNAYGESIIPATLGHTYAPHTYQSLVYQPSSQGGGSRGSMLRVSINLSGTSFRPVHKFDLSSATAAATRVIGDLTWGTNQVGGFIATALDTTRGGVWVLEMGGTAPLKFIRFSDWSVTDYSVGFSALSYAQLAYIPPPWDALVTIANVGPYSDYSAQSRVMWVSRLGTSAPSAWTQVTQSGTPPTNASNGLVWSTLLQCLVSYRGGGSYSVEKCSIPAPASMTTGTYQWTSETLTGVSGATPAVWRDSNGQIAENGTFGRFMEAPNLRCFIFCNSISGPVQAWRLTGM